MMAHEAPINIKPPGGPKAPKPSKNKHAQRQGKLPNGAKPDFGPGNDEGAQIKPKKGLLPNGEKPNFGEKPEAKKLNGKGKKEGNASKDHEGGKKSKKKNANGSGPAVAKAEEGYAGSSFHSSPEALALPKPSFKTSPKQKQTETPAASASSTATSVSQSRNSPVQHLPQRPISMGAVPATPFVYQGMPPQGPPQFPVVAHPHAMPPGPGPYQPGFSYTVNPQGYINYQYPPGAVPPPHPLGMAFGYPQPYPPPHSMPSGPQNPANTSASSAPLGGHKITFNELMSSSK
uniref:Enhancer of mRNA-decapping protein 1 n=1 Tax=Candidozyma auris TaxID=498019 RepID=A0A0L0NY54_CANAR